jgi:hypothetical protein
MRPSFRDAPLGAGPESILTVVMDSGLARGACHRAGQRPDPLARAPGMTIRYGGRSRAAIHASARYAASIKASTLTIATLPP